MTNDPKEEVSETFSNRERVFLGKSVNPFERWFDNAGIVQAKSRGQRKHFHLGRRFLRRHILSDTVPVDFAGVLIKDYFKASFDGIVTAVGSAAMVSEC